MEHDLEQSRQGARTDRWCFLVTSLGIGGLETFLLRFIQFVRQDRDSPIDVICKSGNAGALAEDYRQEGAQVIAQSLGYLNLLKIHRLSRQLQASQYSAICDFTGDFAGIPLYLARRVQIPRRLVFYRGSTHHFNTDRLRLLYWRWVHGLTVRNATHLLSNSRAALDFFNPGWQDDWAERAAVIPNGIPTKPFDESFDCVALRRELGLPENHLVVGHVGRFNEAKNHETILAAAERICRKRDDVIFMLCGRDVPENLKDEVATRGLTKRIRMPGNRSDIPRLLRLMDAFYFPSRHEGQPNALLEALVAGVPAVASRIDPILSSLPPWAHDRLVETHDAEAAANLLLDMLATPQRYADTTEKLQAWARQQYDPRRCFGQFLQLLT